MRIGDLLLEAGLVDAAQIDAALRNREGLRLGSALIAARAVEPDVIARTLAQQLGVPPAKSADLVAPQAAARALVPEALCKRLWALPYAVHGSGSVRVLEVAMRDPEDQGAINELKIAAGMRIDARVAPELLLREALNPRAEIPTSVAAPAASAPAGGGDLELLELDDRPRGVQGRRGAARITAAPSPAAAAVKPGTALPGAAGAAAAPLPPLQYDNSDPGQMVGKLLKWAVIIGLLVAAVFVALRFKQCMTPTTKAVGTHYDSKLLHFGIDFPDSGWRVSYNSVISGATRMEFFYRGGVPEMPVVAMALGRGPGEELAGAARRIFEDLIKDARTAICEHATERPGAIVCRGGGSMTLFGRRHRSVEIEVYAWPLATGELAMAAWINPDRTLSETQLVLGSIVEQ